MTMTEIRRELTERGIASERAMYEKLPKASKRLRLMGISLIEDRSNPSTVPLLGELLFDEDEDVQMAAASALARIGGRAALHMLVGILELARRSTVRRAGVYGLAFMFEDEALNSLLSVLSDHEEAPATRGLAAEGIANLLEHSDSARAEYKEAEAALIKGLADGSPQVRFWSCFALGRLGSRQAISRLQHLADEDKAVCHGWWSVAKEAHDALLSIRGEQPPDREAKADTYS